jgi:hypothetical protein
MEHVPKFMERIHQKYAIDPSRISCLWDGIASEKLQSSYRIYWKQQYDYLKKIQPTIHITDAMKRIAKSWRDMTKTQKDEIYDKYISNLAVKYLPAELSQEDAEDYFGNKSTDYLRKMVHSLYEGTEDIETWNKEKCISFLIEFNET